MLAFTYLVASTAEASLRMDQSRLLRRRLPRLAIGDMLVGRLIQWSWVGA